MASGLAVKEPPGLRTSWMRGAIVGQSPGTQHHGTGFQQYSEQSDPQPTLKGVEAPACSRKDSAGTRVQGVLPCGFFPWRRAAWHSRACGAGLPELALLHRR